MDLGVEEDCLIPDILIPECYKLKKQLEVTPAFAKHASDKALFYTFYNITLDA